MNSQFSNFYHIDDSDSNFNLLENFASTTHPKAAHPTTHKASHSTTHKASHSATLSAHSVAAVANSILTKVPNLPKSKAIAQAKAVLHATAKLVTTKPAKHVLTQNDVQDVTVAAVTEHILVNNPNLSHSAAKVSAVNLVKSSKPTTHKPTTHKSTTHKPTENKSRTNKDHMHYTEKDIVEVTVWEHEKHPERAPQHNRSDAIHALEVSAHTMAWLKGNRAARAAWAKKKALKAEEAKQAAIQAVAKAKLAAAKSVKAESGKSTHSAAHATTHHVAHATTHHVAHATTHKPATRKPTTRKPTSVVDVVKQIVNNAPTTLMVNAPTKEMAEEIANQTGIETNDFVVPE